MHAMVCKRRGDDRSPAALRRLTTNGIDACTATNHSKENFRVCSRHAPNGRLLTSEAAATAASFSSSGLGRSARTGA